jgi:hypothetical protein
VRNVPLPVGIISNLFRHGNVLERRRERSDPHSYLRPAIVSDGVD